MHSKLHSLGILKYHLACEDGAVPAQVYLQRMPSMAGKTFGELVFHLPQATAYGLVQSRSRRCLLNPPAETPIDALDEIVMIRATDLSEADMLPLPEPVPMDLGARPESTHPAPMTESMLSLQ